MPRTRGPNEASLRSLAARARAHQSWAMTADRSKRTAKGRAAMLAKFEREARELLGPDATDAQVMKAAESRRRAFYAELAYRSAKVRRRAAELANEVEQLDELRATGSEG